MILESDTLNEHTRHLVVCVEPVVIDVEAEGVADRRAMAANLLTGELDVVGLDRRW